MCVCVCARANLVNFKECGSFLNNKAELSFLFVHTSSTLHTHAHTHTHTRTHTHTHTHTHTQAKKLAKETSSLCEAANMYVQCHVSEEQLTASGKSVAVSTAQLLLVLQVRMEAGSQERSQLQVRARSAAGDS